MSLGYLPLAGMNGWRDSWARDDAHPFAQMMREEGFRVVTRPDGTRYRWSGAWDGLIGEDEVWLSAADALADFMRLCVPYEDRNLIAHSHGGQVALLACQLEPVRSVVTVGTPRRPNIDYQRSADNVAFWLHIYDTEVDVMAWLGALVFPNSRPFDPERRFLMTPGRGRNRRMWNDGLRQIGHSKVLRDARYVSYWRAEGWLTAIRELPDREPAVARVAHR